jgi:2-dehydro-3-deoxyglucarate aldolase/4-hydroxy-2-oxoheptanedioate aldolase
MSGHLKAALRAGRLTKVFALGQFCHPKLVELVAHLGGYEGIWLDQEHVGLTIPQIEEATRAARAVGIDTFVRMPATDYAAVMRVLEAGAGGVMASMVRTVREARDLVRWAKFHPRGERGVNGTGVDGRFGLMKSLDYFAHANENTLLSVQIEHIDAVNVVEEIAALEDLDFLFVGPADLSQSLGIPCQWEHPELWRAIERVATACRAANRPWAILPIGHEFARRAVDLGCIMLSIGIDAWAISRGVRALQDDYGEFFAN